MNDVKLIATYGLRILVREWRRFVLPGISFTITAIVMALMLLLTRGGEKLIDEKARALNGGDITIERTTPFDPNTLVRDLSLSDITISTTRDFTVTLTGEGKTVPVLLTVVDEAYPLYGEVELETGTYTNPEAEDLLLDQNALNRLGLRVGDTVLVGETPYRIADRIVAEPTSLLGGFRFLPRALMSARGYERLGIDPTLLRMEYEYAYKIPALTPALTDTLIAYGTEQGLSIDIAGVSRSGTEASFGIVTEFLVLAVLITSVLGAVNVYASTLHLIRMEKKSLAVLRALGMKRGTIVLVLGSALAMVGAFACALGLGLSLLLFSVIQGYGERAFAVTIPTPDLLVPLAVTALLMATTAVASFLPAIRSLFALSPRSILAGEDTDADTPLTLKTTTIITLATLIPLLGLAMVLLESVSDGLIAMSIILGVYLLIALAFQLGLGALYRMRHAFPFLIRSIISYKRADGIFGVISFTSLFVALLALGTLTLTQSGLERYLTDNLARSIPTTYILDIQPSQQAELVAAFPELTLFPNVGARILEIDGVRIQDALARGDQTIDGELGREYNLTYRTELLTSETITRGTPRIGLPGEISVDSDFATRARIGIDSQITFLIQGFEVTGRVTSLRETDSRSGLPFFYFVLSPEDLRAFPGVFFGYAYYDATTQSALGNFVGSTMPNVTMIETQAIRPQLEALIQTLMVLVVTITLPPLVVAVLLIVTLVVSHYATRAREGARLRALGAPRTYVELEYHSETLSLTLVSSLCAYGASVLIAGGLTRYYLKLDEIVVFDPALLTGLLAIVSLVGIIGVYLYRSNRSPLRELLSYEDQ